MPPSTLIESQSALLTTTRKVNMAQQKSGRKPLRLRDQARATGDALGGTPQRPMAPDGSTSMTRRSLRTKRET